MEWIGTEWIGMDCPRLKPLEPLTLTLPRLDPNLVPDLDYQLDPSSALVGGQGRVIIGGHKVGVKVGWSSLGVEVGGQCQGSRSGGGGQGRGEG